MLKPSQNLVAKRAGRGASMGIAFCAALWTSGSALATEMVLTTTPSATRERITTQADSAVQDLHQKITNSLRTRAWKGPVIMPITVLRPGGKLQGSATRNGGGISLAFDSTGSRAFPADYQTFLQSVFDNAKSAMDQVFGVPAVSGTVRIANYDLDIFDREAVTGGYYLPDNGAGQREIRFPIYNNPEAAAINLIHSILLAYRPATRVPFDGWEEGMVRAAVLKIARQPLATTGLVPASIEQVLESSYEVGPFYDWFNQRALGGPRFIANNLRPQALPEGGALGGLYLLRYRMSGSAWEKVLAEYPTFISTFNSSFNVSPTNFQTETQLRTLAQNTIVGLRPSDPTVEDAGFDSWVAKQSVLDTNQTFGLKTLVEPTPITSGLGAGDFGVFLVQFSAFETAEDGSETLLSGQSFPIYSDPNGDRFFPVVDADRMDIAGAYGSQVPNFPNQGVNQPYRVSIDIPFGDRVARVYVPAGSIATPSSSTESNFYGTVTGLTGSSLTVTVGIGSDTFGPFPVVNGAFGSRIESTLYAGNRSAIISVFSNGSAVYVRRVNKGVGALAVDLRAGEESFYTFNELTSGINFVGFPLEPFRSKFSEVLPTGAEALIARYNPGKSRYDLAPSAGPFTRGQGFFVRLPAGVVTSVSGRLGDIAPQAISLRPGWNAVSLPVSTATAVTSIRVIRAAQFAKTYADSVGVELGTDIFAYVPGAADPFSGVPESGTYTATTTLLPGRAYFVRCLSPEGAVLLFSPASRETSRSRPEGRNWTARFTVSSRGSKSDVRLVQSREASRSVLETEDSYLPSGFGGLQASVGQTSVGLYREALPLAASQKFRVTVDGLEKGRFFELNYALESGRNDSVRIRDVKTGRSYVWRGNPIRIRASQSKSVFEITIRGARI